MTDERTLLVELSESELILISQSLDSLAAAKSVLAHSAASEQRYKQARAHARTATKANGLGERLFDLAETGKENVKRS